MRIFTKMILAGILTLAVSPDVPAQTAFDAFADSIKERFVQFGYSYRIKGDVPVMGEGTVCFRGDEFRMTGNGLEICSDGVSRWTADRAEKELYIEPVDNAEVNYLANPALLLAKAKTAFVQRGISDTNFSGRKVKAVTLEPSIKDTGLDHLILYLSGTIPVGATVSLQEGVETTFQFNNYRVGISPDGYDFAFDMSSVDKSYLITDLR